MVCLHFSNQIFYNNSITFFTDYYMMKISDDEDEEEDGGCCMNTVEATNAISEASLTLLQEAKEPFFATLMRGSSTQCFNFFSKKCAVNRESEIIDCFKSSKFNVLFWKRFH